MGEPRILIAVAGRDAFVAFLGGPPSLLSGAKRPSHYGGNVWTRSYGYLILPVIVQTPPHTPFGTACRGRRKIVSEGAPLPPPPAAFCGFYPHLREEFAEPSRTAPRVPRAPRVPWAPRPGPPGRGTLRSPEPPPLGGGSGERSVPPGIDLKPGKHGPSLRVERPTPSFPCDTPLARP